ncbi:MAG: 30S ribosomal protein S20 [Candidatus Portiera sp.]|nr:30S ribosomal protein S20 [Portiera sp.]
MANTPSAKKRVRQAITAAERNASQKSRVRTLVKKVLKLNEEGKKDEAKSAFQEAQSLLDRAVNRNLFHKNNVARVKKRLNNRLSK